MKKQNMLAAFAALALVFPLSAWAQQSTQPSGLKSLSGLFSTAKPQEDELIEPDLAFRLKISASGPGTLAAELIPAKGYYLYKDKIRFTINGGGGAALDSVKLPPGEIKVDKIYGKTEVYRNPIIAEIGLTRRANEKVVTLSASYQGCHEKLGVCYPPIEKIVNVTLK